MQRRELLKRSAALGLLTALPFPLSACSRKREVAHAPLAPNPLARPADGSAIPVAFLVSDGAVVIDFSGPWEVFTNVMPGGRMDVPTFRLFTVAETAKPITASGGMKIVPDYTFDTAPAAKVVVIPAQNNDGETVLNWIRRSSKTADLTMSVCTGAYMLAKTGLLAGREATTHHGAYADFATTFPDVRVKRGVRFVEDGNLATSGGLSCGIDLALRVVERYYGREVAEQAAYNLEYQSHGWFDPSANEVYAKVRSATCVVCGMDVDHATALTSSYKGTTYYFCSPEHKKLFDAAPEKILS
jgi:putative intracellular protease/amidase/YHS domain-containing protein